MPVRLRLSRGGVTNSPFYRIVAIDSRRARDAQALEVVGTYNPVPTRSTKEKSLRLDVDRVHYWIAVGAQPSDRVHWLLAQAGLLPAKPVTVTNRPSKALARAKAAAAPGGAPPAAASTPAAAAPANKS